MTVLANLRSLALAGVASLALASCAAGPDYAPPQLPAAAERPFIGSASPAVLSTAPVGNWWELYQDPVLNALVADALRANTDVRIAVANVERARAAVRESRAERLPQTSLDGGVTYGRSPEAQRRPGAGAEQWTLDGGLSVAYQVDLAGRVRRLNEASNADAVAAAAAADAVRVAVVAETTRAYADAASAAERSAVVERTIGLLERTADLTAKRFAAGRTTGLDGARVGALLAQQRAALPPLRAQRDAALFRMAFLTGRPPADLPAVAGKRTDTLRLAQAIPVGDGRALLARRPDIREAERKLAAETARIGVATAELYPQIALGGSLGSTAASVGDLFSGGALRWLVGPLVSWAFPNLAGGRARVAQAEARAQAALASFDGTVLRALQETETALSAYVQALERQRLLGEVLAQARTATRITGAQLRAGRVDFLVVLDAERTLAGAETDLAEAEARVSEAQIALFQALGGGWAPQPSLSAPPSSTD